MSETRYPVTIIATRYGGIYEGGEWAAFPIHPEQVPGEATSDDVTCAIWWEQYGPSVGLGPTPDAAAADLNTKSAADGVRVPYLLRPQ